MTKETSLYSSLEKDYGFQTRHSFPSSINLVSFGTLTLEGQRGEAQNVAVTLLKQLEAWMG